MELGELELGILDKLVAVGKLFLVPAGMVVVVVEVGKQPVDMVEVVRVVGKLVLVVAEVEVDILVEVAVVDILFQGKVEGLGNLLADKAVEEVAADTAFLGTVVEVDMLAVQVPELADILVVDKRRGLMNRILRTDVEYTMVSNSNCVPSSNKHCCTAEQQRDAKRLTFYNALH